MNAYPEPAPEKDTRAAKLPTAPPGTRAADACHADQPDVPASNDGFEIRLPGSFGALGVTALDAADCGPVPTALTAATRNV